MFVVKKAPFQRLEYNSVAEIAPLCAFIYRADAIKYLTSIAKDELIQFNYNGNVGYHSLIFDLDHAGIIIATQCDDDKIILLEHGCKCGVARLPLVPQPPYLAAQTLADHMEDAITSNRGSLYDPTGMTIIEVSPEGSVYLRFWGVYFEDKFEDLIARLA